MVDYFKQYSLENNSIFEKSHKKLSKEQLIKETLKNDDTNLMKRVVKIPKKAVDNDPENAFYVSYIDENDSSNSSDVEAVEDNVSSSSSEEEKTDTR